jgi:hypothetical protein
MQNKKTLTFFIIICLCFSLMSIFEVKAYTTTYSSIGTDEGGSNSSSGISVMTANPSISGLNVNPINVEYPSNADSNTPIIIIVGGHQTSYSDVATLQNDLALQGFVSVCASTAQISNPQSFETSEHSDVTTILNYIGNNSLGIGDKNNIMLYGSSAGGANVLIYDYSSYNIKGILAYCPAWNFSSALLNNIPVFIITGQADNVSIDSGSAPNGCLPNGQLYYSEVQTPKAYIEIQNATHVQGISNTLYSIPASYTSVVEKYIFAFANFILNGNDTTEDIIGSYDSNVVYSENLLDSTSPTPVPTPVPSNAINYTLDSPTPTVPEFPAIAVLSIFLVLSLFAVTILTIRKGKISKN